MGAPISCSPGRVPPAAFPGPSFAPQDLLSCPGFGGGLVAVGVNVGGVWGRGCEGIKGLTPPAALPVYGGGLGG